MRSDPISSPIVFVFFLAVCDHMKIVFPSTRNAYAWWCAIKTAHLCFCSSLMSNQPTESNSQNREREEPKEINLPSRLPPSGGNLAYDSVQVGKPSLLFFWKVAETWPSFGCLECITYHCYPMCAWKSISWHCSWSRNWCYSWLFSTCALLFIPHSNFWPIWSTYQGWKLGRRNFHTHVHRIMVMPALQY